MMYTVGVAISLFTFWQMPSHIAWAQWLNVFMVGFFLYGPQMLIGLCGAELVGKESVGASEGFLGWIAYLGAANAGIPLSIIVKNYGWNYYFAALIVSCGFALLLLTPMMNIKSHVQREAEKLKVVKPLWFEDFPAISSSQDAPTIDLKETLRVVANYCLFSKNFWWRGRKK